MSHDDFHEDDFHEGDFHEDDSSVRVSDSTGATTGRCPETLRGQLLQKNYLDTTL